MKQAGSGSIRIIGLEASLDYSESSPPSPASPLSLLTHAFERNECDLVVCSELFFSGYGLNPPLEFTEELEIEICNLCKRFSIAVVISFARDNNIHAVLIDKSGTSVLRHQKTQLWGDWELSTFTSGVSDFSIVEICGVKLSLLICFEVEFPELTRRLALAGADMVLCPTAVSGTFLQRCLVPTRAYENGIAIVYVNSVDTHLSPTATSSGGSVAAVPTGETFSLSHGEVFEYSPSSPAWKEARRRNPFLQRLFD